MLNSIKNLSAFSLTFIFLLCSCKKQIYGVYKSNYGWHSTNGQLLEISKNGQSTIYGYGGSLRVTWLLKKDSLYLFSNLFYHKDSYNKDVSYFLKKGLDTISALDASDANIRPNYQITENDSMDIFIFRSGKLYKLEGNGKLGDFFYKINDSSELRSYMKSLQQPIR